jgi:class 3 adenylate cyclase/tetratricopeptide (TPR) repeat protein
MRAETAASREERKVVTVLFADLVGFTSRSEHLDPEDVRGLLSPYYARLRSELERFGGTVEKFIGDAVMALFGAPVAHEDDPERAVRAALAIRDWVVAEDAGLQLRIAVNTGEVLVALGSRPNHGEGMASGDVVNTTSRLQSAAPINGILVGEVTHRATSHVITYRTAAPVAAKGKSEPLQAWEAVEARSRFGVDLAPGSRAPLVGRSHELGVLSDALARVRRERSPQLVTIVGVPGIGKSRLVAELFAAIDSDPTGAVSWRQGRSLPYGEGVTFWALGEMVKAQAGILETDSVEAAEGKLQTAVDELSLEAAEAQWIQDHLHPLAGLGSAGRDGGRGRDEAFTAWRRFFEALAERRPLVLVFEDLHWADDNLVDFVEHLIEWASGVPMLIVCNARPELFERRPGWAGGTKHATTLWLAPLDDAETAQLIASLMDRPVMAAETQQSLLARAGGNPLYAEQYVRMLAERGDAAELPLPETVQGIIAARLDALSVEEKQLLQDAAVMGKVFWLGAVSGGDDRHVVEIRLHSLERKDFVQRVRRSSVAGEAEYVFLHVLVRDVAYGQIPRGERADKHRQAAEWIASLGRTEDHAEMLAHHYLSALDLRRAARQPVEAPFAERALEALSNAGDRADSLNAYTAASGFFGSALDLSAPGSLERARLMLKLGRSRYLAGDVDPQLLTLASADLLAGGDRETAATAEVVLTELSWLRGDSDTALHHLSRARELVDAGAPSHVRASVTCAASRYLMLAGESAEAIRVGREALAMAELFGLDEVRAAALNNIGSAKCHSGDATGIEDLEQAMADAGRANAPAEIARAGANLASVLWMRGDLERATAVRSDAQVVASRFGQNLHERWLRGTAARDEYLRGHWQEAHVLIEDFLAEVEAGSPHYLASDCYLLRANLRLARGDVAGAVEDTEKGVVLARVAKDPQILYYTLAAAANVLRESGGSRRAGDLADELLAQLRGGSVDAAIVADSLQLLAWTLTALGRGPELIDVLPREAEVPWARAAEAFAAGDVARAADICAAMGARTEEARDRLWLAEKLIEEDRQAEADSEVERALSFYRSVGATRYVHQGEALMAADTRQRGRA